MKVSISQLVGCRFFASIEATENAVSLVLLIDNSYLTLLITALHGMQTWSSDENSVCPSVCHTCGL